MSKNYQNMPAPAQLPGMNAAKVILLQSGGGISIKMSGIFVVKDIHIYPGGIAKLLDEADNGSLGYKYKPVIWGNMTNGATALSLGLQDDTYVIYVLDDGLGAQFSTATAPFADVALSRQRRDLTGPTCVMGGVAGTPGKPATADGCKVAYFAAAFKQHYDKGAPYKHRFNINLGAVERVSRRVTPTIIDPDVRHPPGGDAV